MKMTIWLIPDISDSHNLAGGVLNFITSIGRPFKLDEITFHATVALTDTITITRVSAKGATYNTIIGKVSLVAQQDYVFRPSGDANFQTGDEIKIYCTNATATTLQYTIKASELLR